MIKMKERVKVLTGKPLFVKAAEFIKEKKTTIIYGIIYGALSFLFGRAELLFETTPLGIAFVCASRDGIPFTIAGMAIAALTSGGEKSVIYLSGLIVAAGFRYALSFVLHRKTSSVYRLNDGYAARISSSAAGAVTVSAVRIIYGGFRYYDLLAGAFFILCACGAVYAYSCFTDRENKGTEKYEAGVAAIIFSIVLSLKGVSIFSVSLSSFAAFLLTLAAARRGGALRGTVAGFLCGAAVDFSLCPIYGTVGFLCGLLSPFSAYVGVLFSVTVGLFIGLQTGGFQTLTSNLPEAASAACTVLVGEYFGVMRKGLRVSGKAAVPDCVSYAAYVKDMREKDAETVKRLSDAYKSISAITKDISVSERRPDKAEIVSICSRVFSDFCSDCKKRFSCGGLDYAQTEALSELLCAKKRINKADLPEKIRDKCNYGDGMAVKLNIAVSEYERSLAELDRAGVVSLDFSVIAKLLSKQIKSYDIKNDEKLRSKLLSQPRFRELFGQDITVCDGRIKRIVAAGTDISGIRRSAAELNKAAETALSVKLKEPEITAENGYAIFKAESAPALRAEVERADKPKEDEIVNGDTSFYTECDDRVFCAVCDGMGSGHDAAVSSRLTGVVLGRLLYAGCDRAVTLDALNNIIRQRRAECFSTLDLLEVDLTDGKAAFYKCGASPSFILRGGKAYRIISHTPPVGIMRELCAEKIELTVKKGDVAIMVSDGITGSNEETGWLCDLLCSLESNDPSAVCDAVMEEAEKRYGGTDDMTVLAVRFSEEK